MGILLGIGVWIIILCPGLIANYYFDFDWIQTTIIYCYIIWAGFLISEIAKEDLDFPSFLIMIFLFSFPGIFVGRIFGLW